MNPIWLRVSMNAVEVAVALLLAAAGAFLLLEAVELGAGWSPHGPDAGFFPFVLTALVMIGAALVLYSAYRNPDQRPFFEVKQEVVDLLKVGLPIFGAIFLLQWLGIYITAGLYLAFFMAYYEKFRWYSCILGGVLLPLIMWYLITIMFNISMPMSMFYRDGILPI